MSSDFDYAGWVRRAVEFHRTRAERPGFEVVAAEAEPPLAPGVADRVAGDLGRPLPPALRAFLERGAAGVDCGYNFEYDPEDEAETAAFLALFPHQTGIYGGARVGPAAELPDLARGCAAWGPDALDAGDGSAPDPRHDVLPVIAVQNGGYVALDLRAAGAAEDPPVVYLSHDGAGARLADSLTGFLTAWERLGYWAPKCGCSTRSAAPTGGSRRTRPPPAGSALYSARDGGCRRTCGLTMR